MQARTSNVPDFDFTMYAEQRLEQYHALKRLKARMSASAPELHREQLISPDKI